MKLQHKDLCVLKGIIKNPSIFFLTEYIYLNQILHYKKNRLSKLLSFKNIYLKPIFTMWKFKLMHNIDEISC
jgi:hypothetical protein